ncbi:ABC-F family ATP-binding cassette domain-containing protein [Microbacterium sp.]|uniref:ABC-F family ATP-binding cassette domain-containing protein n=1 Tax=Microbacterium sp. TaxID=51671 RepID=UPI002810C4F5|nr:ABC-F family ATP-binding cassette domain-containing protein [Microbacterium sp.]
MFPVHPSPTTARVHRVCELRSATVRFADRIVLDRVDLVVRPGDRLAVIGDNGAGKSTLLELLAGSLAPTAGESRVSIPGGIAFASQDPRLPERATVTEAIDVLLADLRNLERSMSEAYDRLATIEGEEQDLLLTEIAALQDRFEARDGYAVDRRVDAALDQLGLGALERDRTVAALSGGERARLALAVAVSAHAELLLLDEPTNDLDSAALSWLEERIAAHRGALVVVTHDRAFLERFAVDVIQVQDGRLRRYGDGYAGFLAARAAERQRMAERHIAWRADLARNEALVQANAFRLDSIPRKLELDGFGHGAFRARSRDHGAMGRIRMAKERVSRLRAAPCPPPPEPLRFALGASGEEHPDVELVRFDAVERSAGAVLRMDQWTVRAGERWLITGANGAGKTTLLRLLAGEITPDAGTVERGDDVRMGWLRQEVGATESGTVVASFARSTGLAETDAMQSLLRFGLLRESDLEREVSTLSVGQRRRLDLAIALAAPAEVLLLDEPTNHLDPELVDQLEEALDGHPGAVITVTHDRHWMRRAESRSGYGRVVVDAGLAVAC